MSSPHGPPRGIKGPGPTFTAAAAPRPFTAAAAPRPQTHAQAVVRPPAPAQPAQGLTWPLFPAPAGAMLPQQPGVGAPPPLPAVSPRAVFPGFTVVPPFADPQVPLQRMQQSVQQQLALQAFQKQLAYRPGAYPQATPPGADMLPEQPVLFAPPAAASAAASAAGNTLTSPEAAMAAVRR